MLNKVLTDELNNQINFEFYSALTYLAMAAYFESEDLKGFANFFMVQEQEEKFHGMKIYNYLAQRDSRIQISAIPEPGNVYDSVLGAFEKALAHEVSNTKRIYRLMDIATEERDHSTISFLKWFIDEQVEEESTISDVIKKLKRIENDSAALYMLDTELAARVFTPPTTTVP